MANTTNIIPNKLTMYQRVEGGVWHYRIKLKTGEWYRLSSREADFEAAKDIANRTYYTADYKEKNRLPQTTLCRLCAQPPLPTQYCSLFMAHKKRRSDSTYHPASFVYLPSYPSSIAGSITPAFISPTRSMLVDDK